jgi:signal peptidase
MATDGTLVRSRTVATFAHHSSRLVAIGYLMICTALALTALVPRCIGWQATVVVGNSMRPALRPGDVLVYRHPTPEQLIPGQLVIVRDGSRPDGLLAHRMVGFAPNGDLRTKGDANPISDSVPVPPSAVVGAARLVVPYVGLPTLWLTHRSGWLIAWAASIVLACYLAPRSASRPTQRRMFNA